MGGMLIGWCSSRLAGLSEGLFVGRLVTRLTGRVCEWRRLLLPLKCLEFARSCFPCPVACRGRLSFLLFMAQPRSFSPLTIYTPSRQLPFVSDSRLFRILSFGTKTNRQRFFPRSYHTAAVWDSLPQPIRFSTYYISTFVSCLNNNYNSNKLFQSETEIFLYCSVWSSRLLLSVALWAVFTVWPYGYGVIGWFNCVLWM